MNHPDIASRNLNLTIDLDALAANWVTMRDLSAPAEASAVIKGNAYGLGIDRVAPKLNAAGCKSFYVAVLSEAQLVRQLCPDAEIFVLNGIPADEIADARALRIKPVLSDLRQIEAWNAHARESGETIPCSINIDTGMNRLGLDAQEFDTLMGARDSDQDRLSNLTTEILMSHLACADEPDHPLNAEQLSRFVAARARVPHARASFANSAGIFMGQSYLFDQTRPGIAIYGAEAVNDVPNPMRQVVSAKTRILQVRRAKTGETVGYGATCRLDRDSRIAICSVGYADGYHRAMSGSGVPVREACSSGGMGAVGSHLVPVLGRVSMDLTAFDVTDIPDSELEGAQWVELVGDQISIDEAARGCGTIGYEFLTSLGRRYQRNYLER